MDISLGKMTSHSMSPHSQVFTDNNDRKGPKLINHIPTNPAGLASLGGCWVVKLR